MVAKTRRMRVSFSPAALASLDEIWDWNARTYGPAHAHRYITFLRAATAKLATLYFVGKPVPTRPKLSYITIRRHRRGHGHVAVYELIAEVVYVLRYYHTAQDWQTKMKNEAEQE
jgi:plasmid stabilization system protein ParE